MVQVFLEIAQVAVSFCGTVLKLNGTGDAVNRLTDSAISPQGKCQVVQRTDRCGIELQTALDKSRKRWDNVVVHFS